MSSKLKIDDTNIKIIKTLLKEPRTTYAKIALDCGLSTPTIYNRFNLLKKSGIINGAIMQIDPKSVGYDCVALVTIESNPREKETVLNFLQSQNISIYSPHLSGSGILSFIVVKNMDELAKYNKKIRNHPLIRDLSSAIWVNTTNIDHPENLVINKLANSFCSTKLDVNEQNVDPVLESVKKDSTFEENWKINSIPHLDTVNLSLIRILANNARISFRKISEKLGISTNNVIKRYDELKKYILKFSSITVNLEKLGYIGSGVMMIKVADGYYVQEIFNKILKIPNIIVGIQVFSAYDILAIAPFSTFNELELLTQKITNILGVYNLTLMIDKPFTKWPLNTITDIILNDLDLG